MSTHEKNFSFLVSVVPFGVEHCEEVFIRHKRDLRLALFELLQPDKSKVILLEEYENRGTEEEGIEVLGKLFYHYCPNPKFKDILLHMQQGKSLRPAPESAEKLKIFRRGPSRQEINRLFDSLQPTDTTLATCLLKGLQDFGREAADQLPYIMAIADADTPTLAQAALMLIPQIPEGIEKAILLYWRALAIPELRFTALNALQYARNLNPDLLFQMFSPILQEYERLCRSEGEMNSLWPEFNMIRNVLSKNGGAGRVWVVGKDMGLKK